MTPPPDTPDTPQLERALGLRSTFFIVTGSVIGSGVFLVASDIATAVPSPLWGLGTWIVAGLISFLGGLIFAELGTRFPKAGGGSTCTSRRPCTRSSASCLAGP